VVVVLLAPSPISSAWFMIMQTGNVMTDLDHVLHHLSHLSHVGLHHHHLSHHLLLAWIEETSKALGLVHHSILISSEASKSTWTLVLLYVGTWGHSPPPPPAIAIPPRPIPIPLTAIPPLLGPIRSASPLPSLPIMALGPPGAEIGPPEVPSDILLLFC